MIVSHKNRFIFLKTRKTAGSSIEIALSKHCGPEDIITKIAPSEEELRLGLGYRGRQNTQIPLNMYRKWDLCLDYAVAGQLTISITHRQNF